MKSLQNIAVTMKRLIISTPEPFRHCGRLRPGSNCRYLLNLVAALIVEHDLRQWYCFATVEWTSLHKSGCTHRRSSIYFTTLTNVGLFILSMTSSSQFKKTRTYITSYANKLACASTLRILYDIDTVRTVGSTFMRTYTQFKAFRMQLYHLRICSTTTLKVELQTRNLRRYMNC
jgi:hypothetical protein